MTTATRHTGSATRDVHEATTAGYDHGYDHANFTDAYGGDPYAEPDVPTRFTHVATHYTAAYTDGVDAYHNDTPQH